MSRLMRQSKSLSFRAMKVPLSETFGISSCTTPAVNSSVNVGFEIRIDGDGTGGRIVDRTEST